MAICMLDAPAPTQGRAQPARTIHDRARPAKPAAAHNFVTSIINAVMLHLQDELHGAGIRRIRLGHARVGRPPLVWDGFVARASICGALRGKLIWSADPGVCAQLVRSVLPSRHRAGPMEMQFSMQMLSAQAFDRAATYLAKRGTHIRLDSPIVFPLSEWRREKHRLQPMIDVPVFTSSGTCQVSFRAVLRLTPPCARGFFYNGVENPAL